MFPDFNRKECKEKVEGTEIIRLIEKRKVFFELFAHHNNY